MGKLSPAPPQCPVCGNTRVKIHCGSPQCLWYRCDLDKCATIFDKGKRYIRNVVKT